MHEHILIMYHTLCIQLGFLYISISITFSVISHELKAIHSARDLAQNWTLRGKNGFCLKFLVQC